MPVQRRSYVHSRAIFATVQRSNYKHLHGTQELPKFDSRRPLQISQGTSCFSRSERLDVPVSYLLGWDFAGRLRDRTLYQCARSGVWWAAKSLHGRARAEALDLGYVVLTKAKPRMRRLVLIKAKRRPSRTKQRTTSQQ